MLKRRLVHAFLLAAAAGASSRAQNVPAQVDALGASPAYLRVEAKVDPLGVDSRNPRLSWIVASSRRGEVQSAYQIVVSSDEAKLAADEGDLWDSGKISSDETTGVAYAGAPLKSGQRCLWKVRLWDGAGAEQYGSAVTLVPMFLLYDYSWMPQGATTKAEGLAIARDRNVVATDEFLLSPDPYLTRDAWCNARVQVTKRKLDALPEGTPVVLINHFPLVRQPTDVLFYPEFALWCGTDQTADWHTRYNVVCSVYGHLHIPRTSHYDGVRFEEVSLGYPREWQRRGLPDRLLRQILPAPEYPPGTLNSWGGHFKVTPEMEAAAAEMRAKAERRRGV